MLAVQVHEITGQPVNHKFYQTLEPNLEEILDALDTVSKDEDRLQNLSRRHRRQFVRRHY